MCSTLVVLLRLKEIGLVPREGFDKIYGDEVARLRGFIEGQRGKKAGGGNFYSNQRYRVGRTLSEAIIRDTRVGSTPMTEALRFLGFKRVDMFDRYASALDEA
ncbi:hypothetical protein [Cutibacterium sp. V947]|uniref:hypothetical protein n=1 Tax=Cutibacterium sp. V947 TaxID=3446480 RepID=UPI003EE3C100